MSAPLNGPEASATLLNRHFTRAGRDPLALAPFEERLLLGRVTRVPSSWGPGGLIKLAKELKSQPAAAYLVQVAKEHSEAAREAGFLTEEEHLTLVDELSWVLGRGMGWVGQDSGVWVGTVNLHHFCEPVTQRFDLAGLRQTCRCLLIAAAGLAAKEGRPHAHSLTWTNGAGFLLVSGIAYDSSRGVGILGSIAAMILGQSCLTLADLAGRKPELANPAAKQAVLGGLSNARTRAAELPPTASLASPADSDRWQAQTQELLEEAVKAIELKGTISPYPTSPQPCQENEEWLDPLSTFAEAVPTLQLPDLASRPEIRSSLKAMGLTEQQKTAVLAALSSGESIVTAGVPEAKAPSLKTALGAWSFHPNAQLMMGSAASPFVAGALKHRVHLPSGIPEDFAASVLGAAARFGLPGAVPFVQKGEGEADVEPKVESSVQVAPQEEVASQAEAESASFEEAVLEPVEPSVSIEDGSRAKPSEARPLPVSDLIEESQPVSQVEAPEWKPAAEEAAPLPEESDTSAQPEAMLEPEEESQSVAVSEPPAVEAKSALSTEEGEGEDAAPQANEPPVPEPASLDLAPSEADDQEVSFAAESTDSEAEAAVQPDQTVPSLSEEPDKETRELDELRAEEAEATSASDAVEAEAEADAPAAAEPDQAIASNLPTLEESGFEPPLSEGLTEEEPTTDEEASTLAEKGDNQPLATPANSLPASPVACLSDFDEPRTTLTPYAWSRTLKVAAASGSFTVHAAKEDASSPLCIGVTALSLPPIGRALLDASLTSINLGLAKGITLEEYRKAITEPSLMRDILAAVSKLVEEP